MSPNPSTGTDEGMEQAPQNDLSTPRPWRICFDEAHEADTYIVEDESGHRLMLLSRLPEVSSYEHFCNCWQLLTSVNERAALLARVAELEEALKPFVGIANDVLSEPCPRTDVLSVSESTGDGGSYNHAAIHVSDLSAARAALNQPSK